MRIYLASNNAHKAEEFQALFAEAGVAVELLSAREIGGMPEVDENAPDFIGNARLKAEALVAQLPDAASWALSDDSGIEVDALGGAPGIHSARYAGTHGDNAANNRKLLAELGDLPAPERTARFRCALVLKNTAGEEAVFDAACEGHVDFGETGEHGFGYDPLFIPRGYDKSFGILPSEVKARLSHRAQAVAQLIAWIRQRKA
jgi:XTP/dITP diphosphohydrolase